MVIRWGMVMSAGFAWALAAAPVQAQSMAQVGKPAELPPADYSGQQYVDSRGCVFMRAGFSGRVTWVPRIGRDRKPLCNQVTSAQAAARLQETQGGAAVVARPVETVASDLGSGQRTGVFAPAPVPGLAEEPASAAAVARAKQPKPKAAAKAAQPVLRNPLQAQPRQVILSQGGGLFGGGAVAVPAPGGGGAQARGCPAMAPVLAYVALSDGGSVAVCTQGDGKSEGWFSPGFNAYRQGAAAAAGQGAAALPAALVVQGAAAAQAGAAVPPGYAAAWDDGRLNPQRGLGTAEGWSRQAQVWTETVPAKTHADVAAAKARRKGGLFGIGFGIGGAQMASARVQPAVPVVQGASGADWGMGGGAIYVQVGSFAQAGNAQKAVGRLAGMGLPVASAQAERRGRLLTSVMAGPFGSAAEARQALQMARQAGFSDAFLR